MKCSRLTLALAVSLGLVSSGSSTLQAQSCDCAGRVGTKACCTQCNDKGLLDAIGAATSRFESNLSKRLLEFTELGRHSQCDVGCDSTCDSRGGSPCPHCAQSDLNSYAPSMEHSVAQPQTHFHPRMPIPTVPPYSSSIPDAAPKFVPPNRQHLKQTVPSQIPLPPPLHVPQPNDSKIDPFRDDSARSGQPAKLKSRPVGYVRPAHVETNFAPIPPSAIGPYSGAFSPLSNRSARRSISDKDIPTNAPEYTLSSGSSRRSQSAHSTPSDLSVMFAPAPNSEVVQASASMPLHEPLTLSREASQARVAPTSSTPFNPLRSR